MKGWAIYTVLLVNAIVTLLHPWSGDSQDKETSLAPSSNQKICNYDIECSNHHPSLSSLKSKGLHRSKMKWWAIYTSLPVNARVRLPQRWSRDIQGQETFLAPLLTSKRATIPENAQTTVPPYQSYGQRAWTVERWNIESYMEIYQ